MVYILTVCRDLSILSINALYVFLKLNLVSELMSLDQLSKIYQVNINLYFLILWNVNK